MENSFFNQAATSKLNFRKLFNVITSIARKSENSSQFGNWCRGFTLIELLVVIAIIGILASVVLASLNDARIKGANASIESNVNNMRSQAEIWYDQNSNSYVNLCIQPEITGASTSVGNVGGNFSCNSIGSEFRISSTLLESTEHFCIDNNGFAGTIAAAPTGSQCN